MHRSHVDFCSLTNEEKGTCTNAAMNVSTAIRDGRKSNLAKSRKVQINGNKWFHGRLSVKNICFQH